MAMKKEIGESIYHFFYRLFSSFSFLIIKLLAGFRVEIEGEKEVPRDKELLIVGPHTSYWDPPLIAAALGGDNYVFFVAGESLLSNPIFYVPVRFFSITVNREDFGRKDYRKLLRAFKVHRLVGILPEGAIREGVEPKKGAVRLVEGTDRLFLPVSIEYDRYPSPFSFAFRRIRVVFRKTISFEELEERSNVDKKDEDYYQVLTETLVNSF